DRYVEDGPEKWPKQLYEGSGGQWLLTIDEKKRILLNNIYGVDIDPQAVEVTKLSLLLKVLEGESEASLATQLRMFQERALPDLDNNIKTGNSLIGPDFYEDEQMMLLDEEEHYRINVFDWQAAFPQVFEGDSPGFDAVIGNPPYIRIQALKEFAPVEVEHYKEAYRAAGKGNYDIYVVFVERGLQLLNRNGRLGYILPHKFFKAKYGAPVRELISAGKHLSEVVHFGDEQVFAGAMTYTALLFLESASREQFRFVKVPDLIAWRVSGEAAEGEVSTMNVTADDWNFVIGSGADLFERLRQMPVKLGDVAHIFVGLQTSADKAYVLKGSGEPEDGLVNVRDWDGGEWSLEREAVKPFLNDVSVFGFERPESRHWLVFPYKLFGERAELVPASEMSSSYPRTWEYLKSKEESLRRRESGKADNERWYGYIYRKNLTSFEAPKLVVQVVSRIGRYAYDDTGIYFTGGGNGPYYGVRWSDSEDQHSLHYLQGILNSRLSDFYLHRISTTFRGGYWSYGKRFIEQLPIRTIDFSDPEDVARYERMVEFVERMLALHERLAEARIERERTVIGHQISATDRQIDRLVYELYGLTEEEIAIVEGNR
ncbi:MAG: Eco57I restriction-modification methylase domain-containing protein, partial [Rubrobacter sp.]|nr:Eco57I restriction-modification methylase domain-containing protein [Rubrobacter sp.]